MFSNQFVHHLILIVVMILVILRQLHLSMVICMIYDNLLTALHQIDMHLVMSLVINHTSDHHPWFEQARQSRDNPYHDYYIWRDASQGVPNNWQSILGGSVWEYNAPTNEYYLHLYTKHHLI